jgi:hypothetical protein
MGKVTVHNYEAFLLEKMEGTISREDLAALNAFLAAHPHLDPGDDEMPYISIGEEATLEHSDALLRHDASSDSEDEMIRCVEGLMSRDEAVAFMNKLEKDADLAKSYRLFSATVLQPDASIVFEEKESLVKDPDAVRVPAMEADATVVFPDKETLYRNGRVIALFSVRTLYRVAAVLIPFILLVLFADRWKNDTKTTAFVPVVKKNETTAIVSTPDRHPAVTAPAETAPVKGNPVATVLIDKTPLTSPPAVINAEIKETSSLVPEPSIAVTETATTPAIEIATNDTVEKRSVSPAIVATPVVKSAEEMWTVYNGVDDLPVAEDEEDLPPPTSRKWERAVKIAEKARLAGLPVKTEKDAGGYAISVGKLSFTSR